MGGDVLDRLPRDRAVLLLDIDGVLNPVTRDRPQTWPDFARVRVHGFDLWLSPSMGAALAGLAASPVWCTTWNDHPEHLPTIVSQLGGLRPHWPGRWTTRRRWKQQLVFDALERFPAVVWIDDDERISPSEGQAVRLVTAHPKTTRGLRREDVVRVRGELDGVLRAGV